MTDIEPVEVTNLDIYGNAPLDWNRVRALLANENGPEIARFLSTTRPDGRPHVTGIGALWSDGDMYIVSGDQTRKSKNLAANPACSIAVRLPGMDVTLEGTASRVTDRQTLEKMAALYRDVGWPAEVDAAAQAFTAPYSAPSAGPPPWQVYRFVFHTAFGVASAEPHGATRWRFART
jgi:Pyridoxamine 5'-phosphate oxidase